jgi:hypothetical protein
MIKKKKGPEKYPFLLLKEVVVGSNLVPTTTTTKVEASKPEMI